MAPKPALTGQPPPARIPRLRYRNALPSDNVSKSSQGSGPHSPYTQEPPVARVPESNHLPLATHSSSKPAHLTSSSLASLHSNNSSGNDSKSFSNNKKKKRTSSMLGFLSLKEPSHAAFEQITQQQRKQTRRTSSPHSSYHVPQKLPQHVPKVNSKWDGVPESAKKRHSTISNTSSRDNRNSVLSMHSISSSLKSIQWSESKLSVMTDGTHNPPNSIASLSASNFSVQDAVPSPSFASSPTAFPNTTPGFPDGPLPPSTPPFNAHMADHFNLRPAKVSMDSPSDSRPSLDGSVHSRPYSPASSATSADTITMDTADTIFRKLNNRWSPGAFGKGIPVAEFQERYKPDIVPESHHFLFQSQPTPEFRNTNPPTTYNHPPDEFIPQHGPVRPVQNFSRPTGFAGPPPVQRNVFLPSYRRMSSGPALPTLYESSIAGPEEADKNNEDDDTGSIAPSTTAPSELSLHWYESPRERLGLGRRLQINDVLPWDEQRGATAKPKKSRLLAFARSSKG